MLEYSSVEAHAFVPLPSWYRVFCPVQNNGDKRVNIHLSRSLRDSFSTLVTITRVFHTSVFFLTIVFERFVLHQQGRTVPISSVISNSGSSTKALSAFAADRAAVSLTFEKISGCPLKKTLFQRWSKTREAFPALSKIFMLRSQRLKQGRIFLSSRGFRGYPLLVLGFLLNKMIHNDMIHRMFQISIASSKDRVRLYVMS